MDYYPMVAGFDEAGTLELAHLLGDGLPGGEDHVRQVLVREAHFENRARAVGLAEALAQVREQPCQARRYLPVQETFDRLLGLPKTLGEGGEQLQGELREALYGLLEDGLPHHGNPGVGDRLGEGILAGWLLETKLAEDVPVRQQRDRGFLICTVDLVQAHRALEQQINLIVGIPRRKDHILGREAPLSHPDAGSIKVLNPKMPRICGGGGSRDIVFKHYPAHLSSRNGEHWPSD